jgi:hypothetical protein
LTGPSPRARPARSLRGVAGLLAGLLLLDVVVNLPAFSPSAPAGSLLAPSIDLLVLVAVCMGIAQAGQGPHRALRAGFAVLTVVLMASAAGLRFGWDAGGRLFGQGLAMRAAAGWAVSVLAAAAVGFAVFELSGLLIHGLEPPLFRSFLLAVISLAAVLQVVSGRKVFTGSVIPKLVALIR